MLYFYVFGLRFIPHHHLVVSFLGILIIKVAGNEIKFDYRFEQQIVMLIAWMNSPVYLKLRKKQKPKYH